MKIHEIIHLINIFIRLSIIFKILNYFIHLISKTHIYSGKSLMISFFDIEK